MLQALNTLELQPDEPWQVPKELIGFVTMMAAGSSDINSITSCV